MVMKEMVQNSIAAYHSLEYCYTVFLKTFSSDTDNNMVV